MQYSLFVRSRGTLDSYNRWLTGKGSGTGGLATPLPRPWLEKKTHANHRHTNTLTIGKKLHCFPWRGKPRRAKLVPRRGNFWSSMFTSKVLEPALPRSVLGHLLLLIVFLEKSTIIRYFENVKWISNFTYQAKTAKKKTCSLQEKQNVRMGAKHGITMEKKKAVAGNGM